MTRVDVIVPCYKYGHFLPTCVGSLLDQEGVDVRVLIIDDCSPDDSAAVGEALARADGRVEFRRHQVNAGHIHTFNEGIDWATAPYLLLISADDALTAGSLARSVAVLEREPGMTMVFGHAIPVQDDAAPPPFTRPVEFRYSILDGAAFIARMSDTPRNPVSTPTVVVRTAIQQQVGGYDPRLPHAGDLEMWLRFGRLGSLGQIECSQAFRRIHPNNMMKGYTAAPLGDHLQLRDTFEIFAAREFEGEIREQFLRRARRGVAMDALWSAELAFDRGDLRRTEALADFALELMPAIVQEKRWTRLVWKRRIGFRAYHLADRLRAAMSSPPPPAANVPHFPMRIST